MKTIFRFYEKQLNNFPRNSNFTVCFHILIEIFLILNIFTNLFRLTYIIFNILPDDTRYS